MAASWSVEVMAPMSTRIVPSLREPPAVSCDSSAEFRVSCEIFPSFIMISPKRSSRRVSEASTIRPSSTWICAVAASERIVMIPLFSPFEMMARSSGKLRSRRLPTSAIDPFSSGGGDLVLPGLLRGVERDVGGLEQLPGGGSALGEGRDSDAHGDRAGVDERKRPGLDGLLHALGEDAGALARGLREDDHELVASVLRHEVDRAGFAHQRLGHQLQYLAAAQVPMVVVIGLQVVHVEHHE